MSRKVLLAYASRRGSTREVVEEIAASLRAAGTDAVVLPASEVQDVSLYDAVLLGTAIRFDRPLPEAVRFVDRFRLELSKIPTALLVLCLTMIDDTPESREIVSGWVKPLVDLLEPKTVGLFAGAAERERLGLILSLLLGVILVVKGFKLGDYRNWEKINKWTDELVEVLELEKPASNI